MKKAIIKITMFVSIVTAFSSCTTLKHSMREANVVLELSKSDFSLSQQVTADATCTKIFGIDFARLQKSKTGVIEGGGVSISLGRIPVIGNFVADKTANYALYELMNSNPGYDVVFYPQFETKVVMPFFGLGFLTKITTVKATARLGKLKQ